MTFAKEEREIQIVIKNNSYTGDIWRTYPSFNKMGKCILLKNIFANKCFTILETMYFFKSRTYPS